MSLKKPTANSSRSSVTATVLWFCIALEVASATWLMTGGLPRQTSPTSVVAANLHAGAGARPRAVVEALALGKPSSTSGPTVAISSLVRAFRLVAPQPVVDPSQQASPTPPPPAGSQPKAKAKELPKAIPQPSKDTPAPIAVAVLDGLLAIRRAEEAAPVDRYVLVGIVGSDEAPNTAIILNRDTGETSILSVGDALDGRVIQSVDTTVVVVGPMVAAVVEK